MNLYIKMGWIKLKFICLKIILNDKKYNLAIFQEHIAELAICISRME